MPKFTITSDQHDAHAKLDGILARIREAAHDNANEFSFTFEHGEGSQSFALDLKPKAVEPAHVNHTDSPALDEPTELD